MTCSVILDYRSFWAIGICAALCIAVKRMSSSDARDVFVSTANACVALDDFVKDN